MLASGRGHPECVSLLLNHGANVHQTDVDGTTALTAALINGHVVVLQLLLHHFDVVSLEEELDSKEAKSHSEDQD